MTLTVPDFHKARVAVAELVKETGIAVREVSHDEIFTLYEIER